MRAGFVLVELVVALVVLSAGMLSLVGMTVQAARTLSRAAELEYAVAAAEGVADSLSAFGADSDGWTTFDGGRVEWQLRTGGVILIVAQSGAGVQVEVWSRGLNGGG